MQLMLKKIRQKMQPFCSVKAHGCHG